MDKMQYYKLRGLICQKYGTQAAFANAVDLTPPALSARLNGVTEWSRAEIERACKALDVALVDAVDLFF